MAKDEIAIWDDYEHYKKVQEMFRKAMKFKSDPIAGSYEVDDENSFIPKGYKPKIKLVSVKEKKARKITPLAE